MINHLHERSQLRRRARGRHRLRRPVRGQGRRGRRARCDAATTTSERSTLAYERDGFQRSRHDRVQRPAAVTRDGLRLLAGARARRAVVDHLHHHAARRAAGDHVRAPRRPRGSSGAGERRQVGRARAVAGRAPALQAQDTALVRTYRASLSDLGALRLHPDLSEGATLPAAGLPWFMALFGRDSLITSFQALPYLPGSPRRRCACSPPRQADEPRRLPRAGARQDPARAAIRRAHRAR